jgi:hypothetical protein
MLKRVQFTRASRRHRIGKAHVYFVMAMTEAVVDVDEITGDVTLTWIGEDERGRELHVVAAEKPDCFLVIHVMPTHYRKEKS